LLINNSIGPPPAYPNLKVPGVNTPIPPGARYGFNEGEWGKPPVDEYGRPLYGDVFGTEIKPYDDLPVEKGLWGRVEEESAEPEDEVEEQPAEEEEEVEQKIPQRQQRVSKAAAAAYAQGGIDSVTSGINSNASGFETPEALNLRKARDGTGTETPDSQRGGAAAGIPRQLYQVLEEKKAAVGSGSLFGSAHTYAIPSGNSQISEAEKRREAKKSQQRGQVTHSHLYLPISCVTPLTHSLCVLCGRHK
jgi:splicing factor 3B subunit 2